MTFIVLIAIFAQIVAANNTFVDILLSGDIKEIYKLDNPREAIIRSINVLNKIKVSNYQKSVIWDVYKDNRLPGELISEDLEKVMELMPAISEDDLSNLNMSDWKIIQTLGQVKIFTHFQASVIANSVKIKWSLKLLMQAHYINKLSGLICGFPKDDLQKIPKKEFKKINSSVFANLFACSESQLQVLHDHIINTYGQPQNWSEDIVSHIGMIILSLTKNEVMSLHPSSLKNLNIEIITKYKPNLLHYLTWKQVNSLSPPSKMQIHENLIFLNSNSNLAKLKKTCFLIGLFLRAYLLLKY